MNKLNLFVLLLPIVLFAIEGSTQRLAVRWNSFNCIPNTKLIDSINCIIIEPERSLLSANVSINADMRKMNVPFALLIARPPANDFHRIVNLNVDACKFSKESQGNRFFKIAYKIIFADSNAPKKCPFIKGSYYFRNIDLGGSLPPFLPANDFQVELNIVSDVDWMLNMTLFGRALDFIKSKGK